MLEKDAGRTAPYIRPSMEAFADLAERLDALAADRASGSNLTFESALD